MLREPQHERQRFDDINANSVRPELSRRADECFSAESVRLEPIKRRGVFPQHLFPVLRRYVPEAARDGFLCARPTRSRQGKIGGPENVLRTDVSGERRNLVEPRGEETLAVEHLRRL